MAPDLKKAHAGACGTLIYGADLTSVSEWLTMLCVLLGYLFLGSASILRLDSLVSATRHPHTPVQ